MISILSLTLISRISSLSAQLYRATDYEILRDTVLIVGGFLAVTAAIIGVSLYFSLHRALEHDIIQKATKLIDNECRRLRAQVDIQAGVIGWTAKMYDDAIEHTLRGLKEGKDLLAEREIIWAKSNLGYYYTEQHRQRAAWHLKQESIALTKIGYEKYSSTIPDFNHPDWIDNYIFACATFVSTIKEKEEVLALISNLLTREDLGHIRAYLEESKEYLSGLELQNN